MLEEQPLIELFHKHGCIEAVGALYPRDEYLPAKWSNLSAAIYSAGKAEGEAAMREQVATWISNNYQGHPRLSTLLDAIRALKSDLEAAIAAERSKEQAKPQQEPDLVQIASDIMGACMNGYLDDKWEDVADCLVTNDFDGLAKLAPLNPLSDADKDEIWNDYCDDHANVKAEKSDLLFNAIEAKLGAGR